LIDIPKLARLDQAMVKDAIDSVVQKDVIYMVEAVVVKHHPENLKETQGRTSFA